ncbi:CRACD-like protein [Perognathus longimembris pacificus]|uniref:CRACD-like protein n=1 Tax=Perognathus longimembris pacificus TaxID=214514 RepID=UPI0020191D35|nr:CRACD-like protein [Perognathus longimembris pacificus]
MISTRVMDLKLREAAEGLGEDGTGKKKSKFKTFKKLFGKKKRKESPSTTGESTWKQNQAKSEVIAIESGPVGYDSEDELEESRGTLGSRALSHDSIFIPEAGQDPARPVRVFSQENVCDRIKALQLKIQCNVRMGPPPPGGLPAKRAEDTGMSSEDDGLPRSPPEMSLLHDGGPSTTIKISLVPSSRPQSPDHVGDATGSSRTSDSLAPVADFSCPPEASSCLDNSAARHKLLVKPRNRKMRRLSSRAQSESLSDLLCSPEEEGYHERLFAQVSMDVSFGQQESMLDSEPERAAPRVLPAPGGARARRARLQHCPALQASVEEGTPPGAAPPGRPAAPQLAGPGSEAPPELQEEEPPAASPRAPAQDAAREGLPAPGGAEGPPSPCAAQGSTAPPEPVTVALETPPAADGAALGVPRAEEEPRPEAPGPAGAEVDPTPSPAPATPAPIAPATPASSAAPTLSAPSPTPAAPAQAPATPALSADPSPTPATPAPTTPAPAPIAPAQAPSTTVMSPTQAAPATLAPATPATPAQAPATPAQAPATPAQAPATPAQAPATPAQAPATPAQAPATPAQAPATATPAQAPATTATPAPATPAQAPATPAQAPATTAPATPAQAPATPAQAPATPAPAPSPALPRGGPKHKAAAEDQGPEGPPTPAVGSPPGEPRAQDTEATPAEPPHAGPERAAPPGRRGEPRGAKKFSVSSCRARPGLRAPPLRSGPAWRSEAAPDDAPRPDPEPRPGHRAEPPRPAERDSQDPEDAGARRAGPGRGPQEPSARRDRSPFPVKLRSTSLSLRYREGSASQEARGAKRHSAEVRLTPLPGEEPCGAWPAPALRGARAPSGPAPGKARPPEQPGAKPPLPRKPLLQSLTLAHPPAGLDPSPGEPGPGKESRTAEERPPPRAAVTRPAPEGQPNPPWITMARQKPRGAPDQPPNQEDKPGLRITKPEAGKPAKPPEKAQEPMKQADFVRSKSFLMPPAKPAVTQRQGAKLSLKEGLQRGISLSHQNLAAQATAMTEKELHQLKRASYASADQPSWMELARKKSQAWSDMPQIIK